MAIVELVMPKLGESIMEATILKWLKKPGDAVALDETVLEIATDKVDSEVPSEVDGVLVEILFNTDDVVQVGQTMAIIETNSDAGSEPTQSTAQETESVKQVAATVTAAKDTVAAAVVVSSTQGRFYSPLVKKMAQKENILQAELDTVPGTGKDGRVSKNDMLTYIKNRGTSAVVSKPVAAPTQAAPVSVNGGDEIIEMTRMGKLIAHHMVASVQTSAHVQSFIEADVTNIWNWRKKVKASFMTREGENLTFTPIFMEAVAKALKDFPMMNIALDGDNIIKRKNINLGMAAALPGGNLIVPVIKNADQLNLVGMTKAVNDLAARARDNKLKPDDIQGGTYTVTNVGTFGSIMGTPIINQPQVGILALGAIRKVPAVIETPDGDFIGIRYKMFLSHSYDHRVVNGALGGQFVKAVADYLEAWDVNKEI